MAVDGHEVGEDDVYQLVERLTGAVGTPVCVNLASAAGRRDECVLRRRVEPPSVELIEDGDTQGPRVRVRRFTSHETRIQIQEAVRAMVLLGDPVRIDLRECPGGDLFEALDSAALFLEVGTSMAVLQSVRGSTETIKVPNSLPSLFVPLEILIGPDTSSAAEIFAGILHIQGKARLVGARSRGKCASQRDFPLSDGSVLRLTTLVVYFSNGTTCEGRGLEPDIPSAHLR